MSSLFEIAHLTRVYSDGSQRVVGLDDVSFTLDPGERLGIVGESGSGKSTLIRLMAALDRPTSGTIRFQGRDISGLRERQLGFLRSNVQLVFQDPRSSLDPRMKVGDIIIEALRSPMIRKDPDVPRDIPARLAEVIHAVGLPSDSADRYPHEFSGGQRQRIAIARALAPRPEVLIADEPVSALDVSVRAQVLNLLNDLVEQMGLTLVFVSHDLTVVRHVCTRVMVMRHGAIVEQGPTLQVYEEPQEDYTRALLAAIPRLPEARRS